MADNTLRHYVWDAPTRLFHWMLVALLGFSWWSAEANYMDWHYKSGITVCGLLIFRILWGVFGSSTARFSQFVRGPGTLWSYVRGAYPVELGHNPIGGWSIVALLLALATQVISGLFAVDVDGIESGPLSHLVDFDRGRLAAAVHGYSFKILLALATLHIVAIIFHLLVKRRNLTHAMITGYQTVTNAGHQAIVRAGYWRLGVIVALAVLMAFWISGGARL
jgi:cytochrome b